LAVGCRRLRERLRATLEDGDREGDADTGSSEERLGNLATRLARFERELERLDHEIRKAHERDDDEPGKGKKHKRAESATDDPDEDDTRGRHGRD